MGARAAGVQVVVAFASGFDDGNLRLPRGQSGGRRDGFGGLPARGKRPFLDFLQDLEIHGLIGSKVESSGRHGRRKFIWTQADLLELRGAAFGYLQEHYCPDLIFRVSRPPTEDV